MAKTKKTARRKPAYKRLAVGARGRITARARIEIDTALAWCAIWTPPRGEARVSAALEREGLASYTPMLSEEVIRRGKRVTFTRPGVGRYVFVGLDPNAPDFAAVRTALGEGMPHPVDDVFSYLGQRGKRVVVAVRQPDPPEPLGRLLRIDNVPLRVPPVALQVLEDGLSLHGKAAADALARFAAGDRVSVKEGPFAAFIALVQHADDVRIRTLLDIFGRATLVDFSPEQLEAAA